MKYGSKSGTNLITFVACDATMRLNSLCVELLFSLCCHHDKMYTRIEKKNTSVDLDGIERTNEWYREKREREKKSGTALADCRINNQTQLNWISAFTRIKYGKKISVDWILPIEVWRMHCQYEKRHFHMTANTNTIHFIDYRIHTFTQLLKSQLKKIIVIPVKLLFFGRIYSLHPCLLYYLDWY